MAGGALALQALAPVQAWEVIILGAAGLVLRVLYVVLIPLAEEVAAVGRLRVRRWLEPQGVITGLSLSRVETTHGEDERHD